MRMNSEMRGAVFPLMRRGALHPLRRSENVTKCISTSQPKGFEAFVEAVLSERVCS